MDASSKHEVYGSEYEASVIADDDIASVLSVEEEEEVDLSDDVYASLREEAESAQRLVVSRNSGQYMRGSAKVVSFDPSRPWTGEKMFRVSNLVDWISGEPEEIVAMMRKKVVRARVSAGMGLGKSTVLPAYVAREMSHRVLYVSLDAAAIGQTNLYLRSTGRSAMRRAWKSEPGEWVYPMTAYDFCSVTSMATRANLFKHFETVIFDESSFPAPAMRAALKIFAVMALPTTNLLMCSANVRDDDQGVKMGSVGAGSVVVSDGYLSVSDAISSGKLIDKYLVDQTMCIVPDDERVNELCEHYESWGVDVKGLDSASRHDEVEAVSLWLKGDSVTPRVLVAHNRFALSYNFPVAYVILWPVVTKLVVEDDRAYYKEMPMTQSMVNQGMARAGRGIVEGASGIVMGPDRAEEGVMTDSEKVEEFILLAQCYVKAKRTDEWAAVHKLFPDGLSPQVAQLLRKVNLPAEIAARYLAADGRFARKYYKGLMFFCQSDHQVFPSEFHEPVGAEEWILEDVIGCEGVQVKVPLRTRGELQVILHAIDAISNDYISIPRWRNERTTMYKDGVDSDTEEEPTRDLQRRRLRKVQSVVRVESPPAVREREMWSLKVEAVNQDLGGPGTRKASAVPKDRIREALQVMMSTTNRYALPFIELPMQESEIGTVGIVKLPDGQVESPGGTLVCEVPAKLCDVVNRGAALDADGLVRMVQLYRTHRKRLIGSQWFDNYGPPWTSILVALNDSSLVQGLVASGLQSMAYSMLAGLNARFRAELIATVKNSNVFKKRYKGLFAKTPTLDQVMRAVHKGKFTGLAQTNAYLDRVSELKLWIDGALIQAEACGVYLPTHITEAQRTLPIHPRGGMQHLATGNMVESRFNQGMYSMRRSLGNDFRKL